jgi:hypothetical protein
VYTSINQGNKRFRGNQKQQSTPNCNPNTATFTTGTFPKSETQASNSSRFEIRFDYIKLSLTFVPLNPASTPHPPLRVHLFVPLLSPHASQRIKPPFPPQTPIAQNADRGPRRDPDLPVSLEQQGQ